MKDKNKLLLVSLIIGVLYVIYSAVYWTGANDGGSSAQAAGAAMATMLVMPHLAMTVLAVIFNAVAFFTNKASFALVAAILYTIALVLFIGYFMFVVAEMVLCYVAYGKMHKTASA